MPCPRDNDWRSDLGRLLSKGGASAPAPAQNMERAASMAPPSLLNSYRARQLRQPPPVPAEPPATATERP